MIIQNNHDMRDVINKRRMQLKMKWKDLCAQSGVSDGTIKNWERQQGLRLDTAILVLDALGLEVDVRAAAGAEIVTRETLLEGFGHGWEERWYIGDDEDPERIDINECVWLNGVLIVQDAGFGTADSAWWRKNYGKKYGVRVWAGDAKPTDEQRREEPWISTEP